LAELAADFTQLSRDFAGLRGELAAVTDRVAELEATTTARLQRGRFLRPR